LQALDALIPGFLRYEYHGWCSVSLGMKFIDFVEMNARPTNFIAVIFLRSVQEYLAKDPTRAFYNLSNTI
jgi:hypothetical protein